MKCLDFTQNNTSTSVIGCVTYGSPDCGSDSYNFTVNHSLEEENSSKVFIPYPLEGEWFISLKTKCSRFFNLKPV